MSYRTCRSVRYRYQCRTELAEVSGTGIDAVPNLTKCPAPVLPVVCLSTYRTEHTLSILRDAFRILIMLYGDDAVSILGLLARRYR